MYGSSHCPCCMSQSFKEQSSVISPFIQEYVLEFRLQSPICSLLLCQTCGFSFFKERFSQEEADKLYSEYRSENYFNIRHKHEPWYTKEINNLAGDSTEIRKLLFDNFVGERSNLFRLDGSVLDYGGDKGQYISALFKDSRKYVFDLSEHQPVPNVIKIQQSSLLQQQQFDFIYFCHTLEHLSDPYCSLIDLKEILTDGGYLYIEVPSEFPKFVYHLNNSIYRHYLKWLTRNSLCFKFVDLVSLLFRLKLNWPIPPFGFIKLHEHINFFTPESLTTILHRAGYEVIDIVEINYKFTSGRNRMIQCLTRISKSAQ